MKLLNALLHLNLTLTLTSVTSEYLVYLIIFNFLKKRKKKANIRILGGGHEDIEDIWSQKHEQLDNINIPRPYLAIQIQELRFCCF